MKKIFWSILVSTILLASGCYVEVEPAFTVCYEEPPFYTYADYCEYYSGGICCGWYVYDMNGTPCYEEWCEWDPTCGWEYEADFCPVMY